MSKVVEAIVDVGEAIWDGIVAVGEAIWEGVKFVWNDVIMVAAEEVFSWLGIEDETIVQSSRSSSKMFGHSADDDYSKKKAQAVMQWLRQDPKDSLWRVVAQNIELNKAQIRAYYRYAESGLYVHGLPTMTVMGGNLNQAAVLAAIDTETGVSNTLRRAYASFPSQEVYYKHAFQSAPYYYHPPSNTLVHTDRWGNSYSDWQWKEITYSMDNTQFEIAVERTAERTQVWIDGPSSVIEGNTVDLIVRLNRPVPTGGEVTVPISYVSETALTEFTLVDSVYFGPGESEKTITVTVNQDSTPEGALTLTATVDPITNQTGFEYIVPGLQNSHTVTILDDDNVAALLMGAVVVNESDNQAVIDVLCTTATGGAFTVDYSFVDGTAFAGLDYDGTPGTLNFAGNAGEIQTITVPLTPDVVSGTKETFTVVLSNNTSGVITVEGTTTVTIVDSVIGNPTPDNAIQTEIIGVPEPETIRYVVAEYAPTVDTSEWRYWLYDLSQGIYPDISPNSSIIQTEEMLPVTILRANKSSITSNKESEEYRTARQSAARLGIQVDDIIKGIESTKDSEGNSNLDQIDDVYLNFAVCPKDQGNVISKIMWIMFYDIIVRHGVVSSENKYAAIFEEQDVNNALLWYDHSHEADIEGVIAEEGKYTHYTAKSPYSVEGEEVENRMLVIQYQKTATHYDEIKVHTLSSMTAIAYDGYHKAFFCGLEDNNFTIPISWNAFSQLSGKEVIECYKDIMRCDVYALVVQHLEWYETQAFANFMIGVALITTVITFGTAASFWVAVGQLALQYAIMKIVIYVAEQTGNAELAAIVGLIAMVTLSFALGLPPLDFTTADGLTKVVTQFSQMYSNAGSAVLQELGEDLDLLVEEYEEAKEKYEIKDAALVSAEDFVFMKSPSTMIESAVNVQYQFDAALGGNYDRLIHEYHNNLLRLGVI